MLIAKTIMTRWTTLRVDRIHLFKMKKKIGKEITMLGYRTSDEKIMPNTAIIRYPA
jgi:hypothetical protein